MNARFQARLAAALAAADAASSAGPARRGRSPQSEGEARQATGAGSPENSRVPRSFRGVATQRPGTVLYRRAVPTSARDGRSAPPLPFAGLVPASDGIAVLDPAGFPGGRFDPAAVDAALHAARASGLEWVVARASGDDEVALRAMQFVTGEPPSSGD